MLKVRLYLYNRLKTFLNSSLGTSQIHLERLLVMQALSLAKLNHEKSGLNNLAGVEWSCFSQWGEDGIIDWLVHKLPGIPQSFVEFGVEDYRESNTRLMLQLRNWRGLVMDGSASHIASIRAQDIYWRHNMTAKCAFIDRDNVNQLIAEAGFTGEIGLLSVDIDGNDYWVWQAIEVVSPAIVICEYNAVLGDIRQLSVPYQADFQRTRAHHSNLYFGASLPALVQLAQDKGYSFVGTTSTGCNAFFVRNDYASLILDSLKEVAAFPSAVRESRSQDGHLTFVSGIDRPKLIQDMPFIDLETNLICTLTDCGELYSTSWKGVLDPDWENRKGN